MDDFLELVGLAFVIFLVLAAAVEAVMEVLRGFTGKLIPTLKGAISLDDALKQAQEFAPANGQLQARLNAIKTAADRIGADVSTRFTAAQQALDSAGEVLTGAAGMLSGTKIPEKAAEVTNRITEAADDVAAKISEYERHRILILRLASAVIGIVIAVSAGVDVFQVLSEAGGAPSLFARIKDSYFIVRDLGVGEIITGIAASSGSSYWHDQLDKVRSLKNLQQQAAAIIR